MFMAYYYPKELAGILQFLQSSMFNINEKGNKVKKKTSSEKFVSKLLKLMTDYDTYSCHEKNSERKRTTS
ncbi:Uncharacterized protein FWK35_00031975, partial [Aphis craccivora]